MADRYFPNEMPDFVEEQEGAVAQSTLHSLLCLPYAKLADKFLRAALDLKEKVVKETWLRNGRRIKDYTLYTGALGTAFLLFKAYQVTNNPSDLSLCGEIIRACDSVSAGSRHVTFICGRAGVCALGAVVAKHAGDNVLLNHFLSSFRESPVAKEIILDGKRLSNKGSCPLMYEWHGKKYWGAAHGLAGIMHVLMDMELKPEDKECIKGTLSYMINHRFPSGNFPSSQGSNSDRLVHWCHGAPGVALTLIKAAQVFQDDQILGAAEEAAKVVWSRGLLKRVGICHGISGNTYVFLSLYRLTGRVEYLYRAKAFACFLLDRANQLIADGRMHSGDRPYSMFEGQGGMAHLFLDMIRPSESRFPAYEL
ncbi:Lanthionine synthetase C-like protein [Musa troglodytarum]|uniref:Lanthionine synthetase C-like protein n=1 Tax=Musa troglodytarum TaxID=320322 RepID=A0A9E7K4S3_9LILI|nr:Lanthionine synthetase C-like protein [Musa troglodytarum]